MQQTRWFIFAFLVTIPLLWGCSSPEQGKSLYIRNQCGACHVFNGKGGITGPDLTSVKEFRSLAWIAEYLADPRKVNPAARMPSFAQLSATDRKSIVKFLFQ